MSGRPAVGFKLSFLPFLLVIYLFKVSLLSQQLVFIFFEKIFSFDNYYLVNLDCNKVVILALPDKRAGNSKSVVYVT